MIHCPGRFNWSAEKAAKRQAKAVQILGIIIVSRIIGFAFFLLGADRKETANHVGISFNTFLSFLTRMNEQGIDGFRDRRKSLPVVEAKEVPLSIEIKQKEEGLLLCLGKEGQQIFLSSNNADQTKIVLLTFAANELLSMRKTAELLGYTEGYVRSQARSLSDNGVGAILDKRSGQRIDYRVGAESKGEIIAQWAVNAVMGESTSSIVLSDALEKRCNLQIPARTIRHHLKKLGLAQMTNIVKKLTIGVKKGS